MSKWNKVLESSDTHVKISEFIIFSHSHIIIESSPYARAAFLNVLLSSNFDTRISVSH